MLIDAEKLRAEFKADDEKPFWHYTGIWAAIESADIVDPIHATGGCYCCECKFFSPYQGNTEHGSCTRILRRYRNMCSAPHVEASDFCSR